MFSCGKQSLKAVLSCFNEQVLRIMALPTVAIVGRPNVGKSTLFNRIAGERISIVEDVEGVTRDRIYTTGEWLNRKFSLIDTGGIDDVDAPFMEQIKHQADIAMTEADVIVFVVSGKEGVTDADVKPVMFWHRTANGNEETRAKWAYNKFKYYGDANGSPQGHTYPEFCYMRSAEMLLIMAEAEANLNNLGAALSHLNTLQNAREVAKPTTAADKDALLEAIYVERRKELLGEGVTGMYDLMRLQKPLYRYAATTEDPAGHFSLGLNFLDNYNPTDKAPYGYLPSNDYRFLYQIPQLEFTQNTVISESEQNPFKGN